MRPPVLFAFLSLLILAACAERAATTTRYMLPPSAGGRLCVNECRQARDHCKKSCDLDRRSCTNAMQEQAIKDYEQYAREQFLLRGPLELFPRDFERPDQCAETACGKRCAGAYQACYESCGGKVVKTTSCRFFCFE